MNLQCLCAKEIARQLRNMSFVERYEKMGNIPNHLKYIVSGFPTNFILWACEENIMDIFILRAFEHKNFIKESYTRDCNKGNNKNVILRKCANYYCENFIFTPITPYRNIRFSCCQFCKPINIITWLEIKRKISNFSKAE